MKTVAVVGAGIAGLACARRLMEAGRAVTLFDKGRRPGGRLASRRAGGFRFEHGTPYVEAIEPAFRAALVPPHALPWSGPDRWSGVPGMSAIAQSLVPHGAEMHAMRHVAFLHHDAAGWTVRHRDAAETAPGLVAAEGGVVSAPFDAVVLAIPAPQAAGLLRGMGHGFAGAVADVTMDPCWTVMPGFAAPQSGLPPGPAGMFRWLSQDSARPGHAAAPDSWTGHASMAWSRLHLETPAEQVLALLCHAFAEATGIAAEPAHASVHRWRYATVAAPLGAPCLAGPDRLALCGDWCTGPGTDAAFRSGVAAAERLLA